MPGHAPGQPRGIRPHSQIPPTQTFQRPPMTNPGMTTMPSSPGLPTYPSPIAQPAMNLSGPMPPMAGANSQVILNYIKFRSSVMHQLSVVNSATWCLYMI